MRREEAHKTRLALELEKMEVARQAAEAQRVALLELAAMTKVESGVGGFGWFVGCMADWFRCDVS